MEFVRNDLYIRIKSELSCIALCIASCILSLYFISMLQLKFLTFFLQKVYVALNSNEQMMRGCLATAEECKNLPVYLKELAKDAPGKTSISYWSCTTGLCNLSPAISASFKTLSIPIMTTLFMWFR